MVANPDLSSVYRAYVRTLNYREEKSRVAAVRRGYEENGGAETIEEARRFLKSHGFIGGLVHFLSPFRMKDIESVRKIYDYMK